MKIIDIHNHLYPIEWINYLEQRPGSLKLIRTGPTNMIFYYEGTRLATINMAGHYDPEPRMKDLDSYGIGIQIMSLTAPGIELLPATEGVPWAKKVNDYFAEVCRKYKGRLYFNAALSCRDVKETVKEMERAYKELGAKGFTMFSNVAGEPIYDDQFLPIYEAAEAYDLPIFIHPAPPVTTDAMKKVRMPLPLYGFIIDTTMAVTGLIFNGILERYPGLKIIHAHLGGVFPYLAGRINDCYNAYKGDYGFSLKEEPSEYYKRNVYEDAISFHLPAMKCALEYLGADHIMIGTDYAHPIGGPDKVIRFVKDLNLSEEDNEKIFWKNATRLFKLDL